jgi:hypothetical protein
MAVSNSISMRSPEIALSPLHFIVKVVYTQHTHRDAVVTRSKHVGNNC